MSTDDNETLVASVARLGQIITGALVTGVVIFLVIATVVDLGLSPRPGARAGGQVGVGGPAPPQQSLDVGRLVTWMAVGLAALALPLSFIVPVLITNQYRRSIATGKWDPARVPRFGADAGESDTSKLAGVYMNQLIIGAALDEGAAFFAGVAYMLGKDPIALGVAIVLLCAIIARFPTTQRVATWIDRQLEMLFSERQAPI
jgi:hypothetical protein